ncbi:hypothetical protein GCM10028775_33190 [Catellatospora paridis]
MRATITVRNPEKVGDAVLGYVLSHRTGKPQLTWYDPTGTKRESNTAARSISAEAENKNGSDYYASSPLHLRPPGDARSDRGV